MFEIIKSCRGDIFSILRSSGYNDGEIETRIITAAYILYLTYDEEEKDIMELVENYNIDSRIVFYIQENLERCFSNENWKKLFELKARYEKEIFKQLILDRNDEVSEWMGRMGESHTPVSVEKLAINLLNVKNNSKVADLCCGVGNVSLSIIAKNPKAKVFGCEINTQRMIAALIKSAVSGGAIDVEQKDVFCLSSENEIYCFDRIFMDHPFSIRLQAMGMGKEYIDKLVERNPKVSKLKSSDWIFNYLIIDLLNMNGRAVTIMTNGATWNNEDKSFRKEFVEAGYIEAIISLPPALYFGTAIPTTMIVFSKEKQNKGIYMIDATSEFEKGRRYNQLSDENINAIVEASKYEESKLGRFITNEQIKEADYALNPSRYLVEKVEMKNATKFNEVISKITRGSNIKAAELDEISTLEETDYQYLMLANIKDGIIDEQLPYIKELDESMEKYCIHTNDLLMSKNGAPYKVAVADVSDDKKVLANGNLFVISLDLEKVNPFYLKALFESSLGKSLLQSITVGSVMPCIGVKDLKNLEIPIPSLEEQKKIADEYMMLQEEIKILRVKTEKALKKMEHIFDESGVV